jgi:hypothetical protein
MFTVSLNKACGRGVSGPFSADGLVLTNHFGSRKGPPRRLQDGLRFRDAEDKQVGYSAHR